MQDTVPDVQYQSRPKGWMDTGVFEERLKKERIMSPHPSGKPRVLYVDNTSGLKMTLATVVALQKSCTKLKLLPKNATDLCQTADFFIVQNIKKAWRRKWEKT